MNDHIKLGHAFALVLVISGLAVFGAYQAGQNTIFKQKLSEAGFSPLTSEAALPKKSDLVVYNTPTVSHDPNSPTVITVTGIVENMGIGNAYNVAGEIQIDYNSTSFRNADIKTDGHPMPAPSMPFDSIQDFTADFAYSLFTPGSNNTFRICADPRNTVSETNESNNCGPAIVYTIPYLY